MFRFFKKKQRHDWDMTFPENDLNWVFKCSQCGETRSTQPTVDEMMERTCKGSKQ